MEVSVQAKIKIDFDNPLKTQVIIRRVEIDDQGRLAAKYGLSKTGEWIRVPEGQPYPDECKLPIFVYNDDLMGQGPFYQGVAS